MIRFVLLVFCFVFYCFYFLKLFSIYFVLFYFVEFFYFIFFFGARGGGVIIFHLRRAIYKPYKKPNSKLTYIHTQSNYPALIIKNLPKSINKRLSTNSKNARIFNEACPPIHRSPKNERIQHTSTI